MKRPRIKAAKVAYSTDKKVKNLIFQGSISGRWDSNGNVSITRLDNTKAELKIR